MFVFNIKDKRRICLRGKRRCDYVYFVRLIRVKVWISEYYILRILGKESVIGLGLMLIVSGLDLCLNSLSHGLFIQLRTKFSLTTLSYNFVLVNLTLRAEFLR